MEKYDQINNTVPSSPRNCSGSYLFWIRSSQQREQWSHLCNRKNFHFLQRTYLFNARLINFLHKDTTILSRIISSYFYNHVKFEKVKILKVTDSWPYTDLSVYLDYHIDTSSCITSWRSWRPGRSRLIWKASNLKNQSDRRERAKMLSHTTKLR